MNDPGQQPDPPAPTGVDVPPAPAAATADAEDVAAIVASQDRRGEAFFWIGIALVLAIIWGVSHEFAVAARAASPAGADAGFPLDDAWIHQVYARSFAGAGSFEYNPGQPEAGLSSPLFGALLSLLHRGESGSLGDLVSGVRAIGAGSWFLLALAAALLARAIPTPIPRLSGFAAAMLVALDSRFGFAAASGMEPLLFAALLLLSAERAMRSAWWSAGLACGLAVLARPEGLAFLPVLAAAALVAGGARGRWFGFAGAVVPPLLAALGWSAFCLEVTGRPLPNTYYAKGEIIPVAAALSAYGSIWYELVAASPYFRVPTTYLLLAMAIVGAFARGKLRTTLLLVAAPLVLVGGLAFTRAMPSTTAFYWSRYFLPVGGFVCTLLGVGIAAAIAAVFDILRRRIAAAEEGNQVPAPISALLLVVLAILPFGAVADSLRGAIDSFARQVADVDRMNVAAAKWLGSDTSLPPDAWVGAQDAGAVRFFGSRPVVDLLGLNDHRLIAANLAGGGARVKEYLASRSPRAYFLLEPDPGSVEFARLARESGLHPMQRFEAPDYSLFGAPHPKSVVLYLPGLSPR